MHFSFSINSISTAYVGSLRGSCATGRCAWCSYAAAICCLTSVFMSLAN